MRPTSHPLDEVKQVLFFSKFQIAFVKCHNARESVLVFKIITEVTKNQSSLRLNTFHVWSNKIKYQILHYFIISNVSRILLD